MSSAVPHQQSAPPRLSSLWKICTGSTPPQRPCWPRSWTGWPGASILMLATSRPGYRPRWLDKSYATQIALQPLEPGRQPRRWCSDVLRDTALPPALEQQLLARAEGNPFFLEELAYTVQGARRGSTQPWPFPDTIQAVLAARVDRLPTSARQLLQAAAVIGKDMRCLPPASHCRVARGGPATQVSPTSRPAEFLYETRFFPDRDVHLQARSHPRGGLRQPPARAASRSARADRRGPRSPCWRPDRRAGGTPGLSRPTGRSLG